MDVAGAEARRHAARVIEIAGRDIARQAVRCVVGDGDRLFLCLVRQDREHRPEDLLARDRHVVLHAGEHRRLHVEADAEPLRPSDAAGDELSALVDPLLNQALDLVELRFADDRSQLDAFAEKMKVGDPFGEGVKLGPVVSEAQFNKIQGLIQKGIDEGAQLVTGGVGRPEGLGIGFYVKPTVFAGVKNDMTIAREEIFGPVLTILPYETEEEAIAIANDTPYGLSGYVSSGDLDHARRVASRLRTGNVHLNGAQASFDAPFGGYKQSGNGREWGVNGFEEFLETKAVLGYAAKV